MRNLKDKILEGLKVNSKSKFIKESPITTQIIELLWGDPDEIDKKEKEAIQNWVEENKVNSVIVWTTKDFLEGYQLIDEENDVSLSDVLDMFEKDNFKFYLNMLKYDKFENMCKSKGKLIYEDKYGFNSYYIKKKKNEILCFSARTSGYIFFEPI